MKCIELYKDTLAFEFDELIPYKTYVYTILREDKVFVIDTFCGSDYMEEIKKKYPHKEFIVINTHNDFDHIWGNVAFKESLIYGHYDFMDKEKMDKDRIKYGKHLRGEHEIILPNQLIDHYSFEKEGLDIIYTPGHSSDSISVIDYQHKCVYVGDNVELPNVQYDKENVEVFIECLNNYLKMDIAYFHGGHNLSLNKEDIKKNILYLKNIL